VTIAQNRTECREVSVILPKEKVPGRAAVQLADTGKPSQQHGSFERTKHTSTGPVLPRYSP
jgi:hypothetical protein